jgi:hypothetical protein
MPQDAPGRKHQDPWELVVRVTVGLPDNSTDALGFGSGALCLTRKSPKLRIVLDARS